MGRDVSGQRAEERQMPGVEGLDPFRGQTPHVSFSALGLDRNSEGRSATSK